MRSVLVRGGLFILALSAGCCAAGSAAGKITDAAREALASTSDDGLVEVIIVMAEGIDRVLTESAPCEVGAELKALARRSQRLLLAELNDWQRRGAVERVVSLPIINGLALTATKHVVLEISTRPDVGYICADRQHHVPPVVPGELATVRIVNGVDWNIAAVKADQAWNTFGLRGSGLVIGSIDTGVDVAHPALAANYRGSGHSWFDAVNGSANPYDDHGHGTATTGNACGSDPAASFWGVAPEAKFIAAKAFDALGNADDSSLLACATWMLDPDGDPATVDMPNVVNNSWSGGHRDPWFQSAIAAWRAAEIYPVFAAGNSGPTTGSIESPGDYPEVMGVGATDSNNAIASFSGRGPAQWSGMDILKPNIVAPGAKVRVPRAGGGYASSVSGTSFACPHVAGAAALIFQKHPGLSHAAVTLLLQTTAVDLGPNGPDNDYGYGLLDVLAALTAAPNNPPQLTFLGTPGYEADGVHPDRTRSNNDVTWKIVYSDADNDPPVGGVKLHIKKGGAPIAGSPFSMVDEGPADFTGGEVYTYSRRLPKAADYTYVFEATDGKAPAEGEGTIEQSGPVITNSRPTLAWLPTRGYATDGVKPDIGSPRQTAFKFGVRYSDPDGDPPAAVRVRIERNGVIIKILDLTTPRRHPDYAKGAAFYVRTALPRGRYRYRFFAHDGERKADGEPCSWHGGPTLRASPFLMWAGTTGYENDGVEPDVGLGHSTVFDFRVAVRDTEGQQPDYVRLLLRRDGKFWKELPMRPRAGGSYRTGKSYRLRMKLPRGHYAYRFTAQDADGKAIGEPTRWHTGLLVRRATSSSTCMLTLTAIPVNGGAELTLVLSSSGILTCRVMNLAGRPVRTLCSSKLCTAGMIRLTWSGRTDNGLRAPDGIYLIEATVRGMSGGQSRALCTLQLRRR